MSDNQRQAADSVVHDEDPGTRSHWSWTWCEHYEPEPCGKCAGCLALADLKRRNDAT